MRSWKVRWLDRPVRPSVVAIASMRPYICALASETATWLAITPSISRLSLPKARARRGGTPQRAEGGGAGGAPRERADGGVGADERQHQQRLHPGQADLLAVDVGVLVADLAAGGEEVLVLDHHRGQAGAVDVHAGQALGDLADGAEHGVLVRLLIEQ